MTTTTDDLTKQIEALQQDVQRVNQLRHTLEGKQAAAQQQLEHIDSEIRALGFDPETCDTALAQLEEALHAKVAEAAQAVAAEMQALRQVEATLSALP